jgi:flagellar L-ring protein precursor FlgH
MKQVALNMWISLGLPVLLLFFSCGPTYELSQRMVPAEEFSKSVHQGKAKDYSIFRVNDTTQRDSDSKMMEARASLASNAEPALIPASVQQPIPAREMTTEELLLGRGFQKKASAAAPETIPVSDIRSLNVEGAGRGSVQSPQPPLMPPGSRAPYATGQATANPSLWPDESQGASLFTDFRAFHSMDVITILVKENNEGKKRTNTNARGSFSLLAGISNFFGIETSKWAANNEALDPSQLINAKTESNFRGEGETNRKGTLTAALSAVIMEVLPNGLMRIEGSKIVSVDDEEEVMVISGLVRARDINSQNQIESNRVANMRIDFYGRGVLAEKQSPGWGARLMNYIWPF